MLKYFIVLIIVATKCSATLIEDSPKTTSWLSVLTPKTNITTVERPLCSGWLNVTRKYNQTCACGGSPAPLLEVSFPDGVQGEYPFISVDTEEQIRAAINTSCVCSDATDRRLMGKQLEAGFAFFASCEPNPANRDSVGCWPEIFAKSPPTRTTLLEVKRRVKYINEDWKMTCFNDAN